MKATEREAEGAVVAVRWEGTIVIDGETECISRRGAVPDPVGAIAAGVE